jgi:hypothetical protein
VRIPSLKEEGAPRPVPGSENFFKAEAGRLWWCHSKVTASIVSNCVRSYLCVVFYCPFCNTFVKPDACEHEESKIKYMQYTQFIRVPIQ